MAIEKRLFGRTGHMSSAIVFGAAALARVDQGVADKVLDLLIEHDIDHIDTAASYGDAELRVGAWMDRHRDRFFLATKTGDRDYQAARDSIRRSLERLRTDRIDLIQLHALYHPDEWERAMSAGGALEACIEAREQGLVRHIGVTGHSWTVAAMHRRSLERFDFDSILLPWNWFAAQHKTYAPDFERTVALAASRKVAVQTIKGVARGPWAAGVKRDRTTWYQPLEAMDDIRPAVHWVLSRPGVFLLSAGDVGLLPSILKAASEPVTTPSDETMAALSARTGLASIFGI
jgi:aryl-alcohol dehydrogenase-like predicted oxidoreductase